MAETIGLQNNTQCNDTYLLEKRYEVLLDINNKKLFKEINDLKQEISRLGNEIDSIKQSQKSQRIPVQQVHEPSQFVQQNTQPQNFQQQPVQNQQRPQQGVAPEEVPLDKYFYFGRK